MVTRALPYFPNCLHSPRIIPQLQKQSFLELGISCNQAMIWYNDGELTMMTAINQTQSLEHKAEALYEQYGKPLEKTHKGNYIAIAENGKTIIGTSALEVMQEAKQRLGPGNFIFKLGERSIGKWL